MATAEITPQKRLIVAGIDSSQESAVSFSWAIGNLVRPGDHLVIVYAQQPTYQDFPSINDGTDFGLDLYMSSSDLEALSAKAEQAGKELVEKFMQTAAVCNVSCEGVTVRGDARDRLVEKCIELKADLLLVGSRGLGAVKRALLGSVSDYCVHHAPCPILIIKNKPEASPESNPLETDYERRIVVAVDTSEGASYAFTWALENVCKSSDKVIALHVVPPATFGFPIALMGTDELNMGSFYLNPETKAELEKSALVAGGAVVDQFVQQAKALRIPCEGKVMQGDARELILEEVGRMNASMLVVGSRGMGLVRRAILGSVSDHVSHMCACPVLIVRHPKDAHPSV